MTKTILKTRPVTSLSSGNNQRRMLSGGKLRGRRAKETRGQGTRATLQADWKFGVESRAVCFMGQTLACLREISKVTLKETHPRRPTDLMTHPSRDMGTRRSIC